MKDEEYLYMKPIEIFKVENQYESEQASDSESQGDSRDI
jgi:hypothetical protein